jgi:diguanylate cyclase (GGDEF)-like protein
LEELKATERLPSPQGVAMEIIRLTRGDNFTNAQLAHVIQSDPALCGRLIRAANCAALSGRRAVASVSDAILVLGIPAVRQLVLGFSLISRYQRGACAGFDYQRFWGRALLLAIAAQNLCKQIKVAAAEEAFACGLLAHIGRLALATAYEERYAQVLKQAGDLEGEALAETERAAFALDHLSLGGAMLADWGFPNLFVSALRARFEPNSAGFAEGSRLLALARAFHLSERIASLCAADEAERQVQLPGILFEAARLAIDSEEFEAIIDTVQNEWREWVQILDVPLIEVSAAKPIAAIAAPAMQASERLSPNLRMRILDLGLNDPAIESLRAQIMNEGHTVVSTHDTEHALAGLVEFKPHLLLLALDVPENDGLAFLKAIRATQFGAHVYIIALAHGEQNPLLLQALDLGADDCLGLPFGAPLLMARLRAAQRMLRAQNALSKNLDEMRHFAKDLAVNNRRLKQQLLSDELSGLPNLRYCRERLEQAWTGVQRRGGELAVLLIDIDNFRRVNDLNGHAVGDEVLCRTAMLLRGRARLQDVVCRTGGAEFTVICLDTSAGDALRCAERLREIIEDRSADAEHRLPAITVSVGIAAAHQGIKEADELLRRAGRALYQAKTLGRNCSHSWGAAQPQAD